MYVCVSVRKCVRVCVRACVRACVSACVRECGRACVRACVRARVHTHAQTHTRIDFENLGGGGGVAADLQGGRNKNPPKNSISIKKTYTQILKMYEEEVLPLICKEGKAIYKVIVG